MRDRIISNTVCATKTRSEGYLLRLANIPQPNLFSCVHDQCEVPPGSGGLGESLGRGRRTGVVQKRSTAPTNGPWKRVSMTTSNQSTS
jgi:hypothetical protein